MKSPLSEVKERFGDKAKLVAAVQALATKDLWLDRTSDAKSLESVSNRKLLRLHDVLSRAKRDFGTRQKLIGAILEASKRTKDAGLQKRLEGFPLPRLLDLHAGAKKSASSKKSTVATKSAAVEKGTAAKGTAAKGTPAKGTAAKGTPAKGTAAKGTAAKGTAAKGTAAKGTAAKKR